MAQEKDVRTQNRTDVDQIRSIMDGFTLYERNCLFTCQQLDLHKQMKVSELADAVVEQTGYHNHKVRLLFSC